MNINANNGAGIKAVDNSTITKINSGTVVIQTGKNSKIVESGNAGNSVSNEGRISTIKVKAAPTISVVPVPVATSSQVLTLYGTRAVYSTATPRFVTVVPKRSSAVFVAKK